MNKIDNTSNAKFKIANEGKNLIKKESDNFDSSNNYDIQKNTYIDKKNKNDVLKNIMKTPSLSISERSPAMPIKSKDKNNIISSKELKSELNNDNNIKIDNTKNVNKEPTLTSSFVFYKENKVISNFKKLYGLKQKYISIILLVYSLILFLISILDLMRKLQQKKQNFFLCNLIIFILEMVCSGLIILFHIIYYFINIGNNYIIFLIMSIIIIILTLIYAFIFVKQKVRLLEIILHMVYNLFLVTINLIYLFMSYNLVKENNKVQQNIEDIMNFSFRNEKIPDFDGKSPSKEKNKEHKVKGVALVEEDK